VDDRDARVTGVDRRSSLSTLAAGLAGFAILAMLGLAVSTLPALLLLGAGRGHDALSLLLGAMLSGVVALPVLIAPRILPDGASLSRAIAPGLHGQLELMRRRLDAPRVDEIVLDHGFDIRVEFGARSVLSPRARRRMIIGLPLMHALSTGEFRALMARALAVTSRRHGRVTIWLVALNAHWQRLLAASSRRSVLRLAGLHAVLRRYSTWYEEKVGPVLLEQERAADRMACTGTRPDEFAAAILRCGLARRFIDERVLPDLRSQIRRFGEPASGAHTRFEHALRGAFDDPRFDRWLVDVLRPRRSAVDDGPTPHDRLDAIGFGMNRPETFGRLLKQAFSARKETDTAAGHYLGSGVHHVTVSIEKSWIDQIRSSASTPVTTDPEPPHAGATLQEAGPRRQHPTEGAASDVRQRHARSA
jgi:hypothetical protein